MNRFSLKDLLIEKGLLAAGITAICGIWRLPNEPTQISLNQFMWAALLLWLGAARLWVQDCSCHSSDLGWGPHLAYRFNF